MLSVEELRQIRRLHVQAGRRVDALLTGEYRSAFKGSGMEFEEVREYQIGDDIRTIDWNVTSRMGHPYVKKYVEERELTVMLLVDASASGDFGTVASTKRAMAAETDPNPYRFFHFSNETHEGEDVYFCRKMHALGEKMYLDPECECGHIGTFSVTRSLANSRLGLCESLG